LGLPNVFCQICERECGIRIRRVKPQTLHTQVQTVSTEWYTKQVEMSSFRGIFSRLGLSDSASSSASNLTTPASSENVSGGRSSSPRPNLIDRLRHKHDGSSGLVYAPSEGELFPATNPDVDGEECLLDCSTCAVKYPAKFKVENDRKLYGHIKAWDRHILIATGKSDWTGKIHTERGSLAESIDSHGGQINGRVSDWSYLTGMLTVVYRGPWYPHPTFPFQTRITRTPRGFCSSRHSRSSIRSLPRTLWT
jgi:hypothetical protein